MLKKINLPAFSVIVLLPILLVFLTISYKNNFGIGKFEILLTIVSYYIYNITVGIGLHRLWSHNSYKTNNFVEAILTLLSAATLQGPVIAWASDHHNHHTFTDTDKDPHSPLKYKNRILGFLWSHMGWMIFKDDNNKNISKTTIVKLGRNKLLMWQLKHYWTIAILMNILPPLLIGYLIGGNLESAYAGLLFIGVGRAIQQQMTFCINSWTHFVGDRKYTSGTARDSWSIAFLLLGENWHNFHHAFPSDYRNGHKWYHFDAHKWIIFLMSKVGLAWDLQSTSEERISARMNLTQDQFRKNTIQNWESIKIKSTELMESLYSQYKKIETSKQKITSSFSNSIQSTYFDMKNKLENILTIATKICEIPENSTDDMLKKAYDSLEKIEKYVNTNFTPNLNTGIKN
jgi:stearoyl-CoA desaturase (delta-9 desaturase)